MATDVFSVTAAYDRNPPNYLAGETIKVTVSGSNLHTADPTTVVEPIGAFTISVSSPSGAQTSISAPAGGAITRIIPGVSTTEQVFINAAAGAVLILGGRSWTVSVDRKSLTSVA